MTEKYTPTTDRVREVYASFGSSEGPGASAAQFDRWLAAHDAQVRAEALREAAIGARSTRFQIAHGEHITYADTFEAGVRSVQQALLAGADYASVRIADTTEPNRSADD